MLGNRGGKFHRDDRTLGKRRWATHHWICCELHYKGTHHEPMGKGYTSLFFLDEVTALAAGHRPCFFCRRAEAKRFMALAGMSTDEFDRQLHAERIHSPLPRERPAASRPGEGKDRRNSAFDPLIFFPLHGSGPLLLPLGEGDLPTGLMLDIDGAAFAVKGRHLLRWSFAGYTGTLPRPSSMRGRLLTPPSIAAILRGGYQPRWHESALQWGDT